MSESQHEAGHQPEVDPIIDRMVLTLESGRVARYHSAPTVQSQSDGQHAWGVAVIVLYLTGGNPSLWLLKEAIMHDTEEIVTGDIPFTVKRDHPSLKKRLEVMSDNARTYNLLIPPLCLTPQELAILKLADTLEGFIWCVKTERGNLIRHRWAESYQIGMVKFLGLLTPEQELAAVTLFEHFNSQ